MIVDPSAPVYPQRKAIGADGTFVDEMKGGITIRAHFAAMAMQGMLADTYRSGSFDAYARDAIAHADALITELNKPAVSP